METNAGTADNVTNQTNSVLATAAPETQTQVATPTTPAVPATNFQELLGQDGKFVDGWTGRLPEQLSDYSKTLAKFKSPIELMHSYANLEKEFSKKSTPVKMPGAEATEEDWNAYKQAIGANYKPEDYGLKRPEDIPEEQWNGAVADRATQVAAKYGIPTKALHELVDVYNDSMKDVVGRAEQMQAKQFEDTMGALKKDWGVNLNNNLQRAQRAALAVGLDPSDASIGNNAAIIKALMKVDELLGEDKTNVQNVASSAQTYQEMYDAVIKSADYMGKNGMEKQMAAAEKLKNIFAAMNAAS